MTSEFITHGEVRRLKARIAELENPWRPIESAPRDGTRVLLYTPTGEIGVGEYVAHWAHCSDGPGSYSETGWWVEGGAISVPEHGPIRDMPAIPARNQPTHWAPLPAPPTPEDTP